MNTQPNSILLSKIILPLFVIMLVAVGSLSVRTIYVQSATGERISKLEGRQDATEAIVADVKHKVDVIYEWVLKQQGAQEKGEQRKTYP